MQAYVLPEMYGELGEFSGVSNFYYIYFYKLYLFL